MNADGVNIADIHGSSPSSHSPLASDVNPSDEQLKAAIDELHAVAPEAGAKSLRKLLKKQHPLWQVSETRVHKAFKGTRKAERTQEHIEEVNVFSFSEVSKFLSRNCFFAANIALVAGKHASSLFRRSITCFSRFSFCLESINARSHGFHHKPFRQEAICNHGFFFILKVKNFLSKQSTIPDNFCIARQSKFF